MRFIAVMPTVLADGSPVSQIIDRQRWAQKIICDQTVLGRLNSIVGDDPAISGQPSHAIASIPKTTYLLLARLGAEVPATPFGVPLTGQPTTP